MGIFSGIKRVVIEIGKKAYPIVKYWIKPVGRVIISTALTYMGQSFIKEMITPVKPWAEDPAARELIMSLGKSIRNVRRNEFRDDLKFSEILHTIIVNKLKRSGFGEPPGPE